MILSTQTDFLGRSYGEAEAIRMLAKAGFDAYDFSFFPMFENPEYPINGPDFREYAQSLRAVAEEAGIACNQAQRTTTAALRPLCALWRPLPSWGPR